MPMYEYTCPDDGETITLLRSMADADKPVEDPKGCGRVFVRALSKFAVGATTANSTNRSYSGGGGGGGCPCGNPDGPCNN